jgi:hypothetical protein
MIYPRFIPIGMFGMKMTQQHSPSAGKHPAGNRQPLGSGFGANDFCHFIIHDFDVSRIKPVAGLHSGQFTPDVRGEKAE